MAWKNININNNMIKAETAKSVLISMPNNSIYRGYQFWHPSKLVRNGRHSAASSIGYTDDFTFRLEKYGNGKYNSHDVVSEKEITATEFEKAFEIVDSNIFKPETDKPVIHTPSPLEPVNATAHESLIDRD